MSPNMPVSLLFRWTEPIATRFSTGIHGPQTMNPSSSGDLLTFVFLCQKKLKLLDVNKRLGDRLSFKSESPVPNAGCSFGLLVYLFCIILRCKRGFIILFSFFVVWIRSPCKRKLS